MESQKRQRLYRTWLTGLTVFCILAYLAAVTIMNVYGFKLYCNTDMYADTLIAKLMWEGKTLFPDGWIFSNQYYVVATPVFAALFYGLVGDVNAAMVLATELMTVLIFLSLNYLVRAFTKDRLVYLVSCLLLFAAAITPDVPMSVTAELFWIQASYYSCYLIGFFFVVGDYVRTFQTKDRRMGAWLLSLFLSFALGVQSLRQTVAMVLPLLVCELFLALRRLIQGKKPWDRENVGSLIRVISYGAANVAGLITLEIIDPLHSTIFGDFTLTPFHQLLQRIPPIWPAFAEISGLKYAFNEEFAPVCTVMSLFMTALVVAALVLWVMRMKKPETALELAWLVCLIGLVGTALSTVVTGIILRTIYLFLWYPLVVFSGLIVLQKLPINWKQILILLICLVSLGNLFPYHGFSFGAQSALENSTGYGGKAFRLARAYGMKAYAYDDENYAAARDLCDWAMGRGFEYVYGDWYTAPKIAVHSGGAIEAGYWWQESMYVPNDHLTSQHFYDEEDNAKAIYVFTADNEEEGLRLAREKGAEMTKAAQFGPYTAYTSSKQLFSRPWE